MSEHSTPADLLADGGFHFKAWRGAHEPQEWFVRIESDLRDEVHHDTYHTTRGATFDEALAGAWEWASDIV